MSDIRISIDTGGTFTDAVMRTPDGSWRLEKVLSSSSLRASVVAVEGPDALIVRVPALARMDAAFDGGAFVKGWRVRGAGVHAVIARALEQEKTLTIGRAAERLLRLELDSRQCDHMSDPDAEVRSGGFIDLAAPWPAPVLAARMLLQCPSDHPLPPIAMRLGTTRGTNAMLEGRFDPVLLIVNEGFAETLAIGDQRRDRLFDPAPLRRPPIHRAVVEVTLRQDASGGVIRSLDEDALHAALRSARERYGVTHAAVLLMHAWRNPEPEAQIAAIARSAGFVRVVTSHECSGVEGYLPRGLATVTDAALSSAVGDFLDAVRSCLAPGSTLEVATSTASLRPGAHFPPRESLLSGPAGGAASVLDLVQRHAGTRAGLGFDMGGTSTDAMRASDHLPRRDETPIGGHTLAVPSLVIESVAAGGGSICVFEQGVLRVGPESAGSEPGPACYGRGGPLTVTDVDVLLGRVDQSRFAVPLDAERSRAALATLLEAQRAAGVMRDESATLEALRDIADHAMASALRVISARDGFDPAQHMLVAFGGAGGQHACAVAERLGIEHIVHPHAAGLLSAVGMARLQRDRVRSESVHRPLDARALAEAVEQAVEHMRSEPPPVASAALAIESIAAGIGWRGHSAVVEISCDPASVVRSSGDGGGGSMQASGPSRGALDRALIDAAAARYRAVFGAAPPEHAPELASVRIVAQWRSADDQDQAHARQRATTHAPRALSSNDTIRMWSAGRWCEALRVDRGALMADAEIHGPAVVADAHSTLVIDVGWRGTRSVDGVISLQRLARANAPAQTTPEVRAAALAAIAVEMGEQLRRTAVSVNVRDRLDYSCGLLDGQGRLATTAPHVPVHLGALGACVRAVMAQQPLRANELLVTNDPAFGGSHLPDVTVVMAVGTAGHPPIAFVAARAHHAEIGGTRPGSMPPSARTLDEEGVVIPPTTIGSVEAVDLSPVERMLRSARFPSRAVEDNLADLAAAVAALRRGASLIQGFIEEHGATALGITLEDLRRRSAARVVEAIARLPADLDRSVTQCLDDGWCIQLRLTRGGDRLRIDFSGSSAVHPGNLNAPRAVVRSAVMYALRVLIESFERQDERTLPLNDGLLEPVDLVVPSGFLDPPAGAPVAAGNTETSQRVVDALLLGLGVAACSQGTMNNLVMGGEGWSFYETIAGGMGATPRAAGASGLHAHMTNTRITDPETLERRLPLRLRRFSYRAGSGGAAPILRGGDGLVREIEFLAPGQVSFTSQRRASGPEGLNGGGDGAPGTQSLARGDGTAQGLTRGDGAPQPLDGLFEIDARPGDRLRIETPGGGACGSP